MTASWQTADLDEVRPDLFVLNNAKVRPFLRGEGELSGKLFRLQTTRREGWLARVRMGGFIVRSLQDRVEALVRISADVVPGAEFDRPLTSDRERIATWDTDQLRWRDLSPHIEGKVRTVRLRLNEVIRRRKSRGEGEYFIVTGSAPDRINLRPIGETNALIHAYAMLQALSRSRRITPQVVDEGFLIPAALGTLPDPHRKALDYLSIPDLPPGRSPWLRCRWWQRYSADLVCRWICRSKEPAHTPAPLPRGERGARRVLYYLPPGQGLITCGGFAGTAEYPGRRSDC